MKKQAYKYVVVFSCLLLSFLSAPFDAIAQNNSVSDYVPPPLFGSAPAARPTTPKKPEVSPAPDIIELRKNDNQAAVKENKRKDLRQEKAMKAVARSKRVGNIPLPKRKPGRSIAVPQSVPTLPIVPKVPAPVEPKEIVPVAPPPASEGVVKGPKTMPAVKKKDVAAEKIDENTVNETQTNMLARVQTPDDQQVDNDDGEQKLEISKDALSTEDAKSLLKDQLVLIFNDMDASLSEQKKEILSNKVVPVFVGGDKRLNITAFASPQSQGLNGDKRLALSRALAVRSFLLEKGVPSNQMNIRSLGSKTTKQPYDRVELQLMP